MWIHFYTKHSPTVFDTNWWFLTNAVNLISFQFFLKFYCSFFVNWHSYVKKDFHRSSYFITLKPSFYQKDKINDRVSPLFPNLKKSQQSCCNSYLKWWQVRCLWLSFFIVSLHPDRFFIDSICFNPLNSLFFLRFKLSQLWPVVALHIGF